MIDRIKKIMEQKGLNASSLATVTRINSTTISHIVQGRGKEKSVQMPSTDVLTKILTAFPDVNAEWLMLGTGPMYKGEKATFARDLFAENVVNPPQSTAAPKYPREIPDKTEEIPPKIPKKQVLTSGFSPSETVEEIVVFFKDRSFLKLKPQELSIPF
jgi:transcriptional regulator with XRE-family HTH domain